MHKKLKLVALLILISSFANAVDKKEAFIKSIDYCNCRIASTYCKQYSEMKPSSKEKKSYYNIENIFKCVFESSLPFDSINKILKHNNFEDFSKKSSVVCEKIAREEVETLNTESVVAKIISGIYESNEFKTILTQYSEVGYLRKPLTNELTDYLNKFYGSNTVDASAMEVPMPETELQKEVSRLERLIEENKTSLFTPNWLSIILIVVFSGIVFMIMKMKLTNLEERTDRHRIEIDSIEKKKLVNNNQPTFQNTNIKDLKESTARDIHALDSKIASLKNEIEKLNNILLVNSETPQSTKQVEKQQRVEILYAPIPNPDGSFTATNVTNIESQSSSFYKFTITDNLSQKATFEFLNVERAIKDAISSSDLVLKPICNIKNEFFNNPQKIKTTEHGTVKKQNDRWILVKKAEIEYE